MQRIQQRIDGRVIPRVVGGGEAGQQGVLCNEGLHTHAVARVKPHSCGHTRYHFRPYLGMWAIISFANVMKQGRKQQQIGPGHIDADVSAVGHRVQTMHVNSVDVARFAGHETSNMHPFWNNALPQPVGIHVPHDTGRVLGGSEKGKEITGRGRWPRRGKRRGAGKPAPRSCRDGKPCAGRCRPNAQH